MNRPTTHDWDTEMELLGRLLRGGNIGAASEVVRAEDFGKPSHQVIFAAMLDAAKESEKISLPRLFRRLKDAQQAEAVGGYAYLTALDQRADAPGTEATAARTIARDARRRHAVDLAHGMIKAINEDPAAEPATLMLAMQAAMEAATPAASAGWTLQADLVGAQLAEIRERTGRPADWTPGLTTGYPELDRKLGGLQAGRFYLITGRPAMGKSALAQNIAEHVGRTAGVGFITLEMPGSEVAERALVMSARVNASRVRDGQIDDDDWRRLCDADAALAPLPIYVDDSPAATIAQIWAKARKLKERCPDLGVILLDYIQLATAEGRGQSRQQEIGKISRGCKAIAKELGIAVVALAQLSRKPDERPDKRPVNSDLREAGDLEQDADVILHVYRDEVYSKDACLEKGIAEIIVGKNRGGAPGMVKLRFIGHEFRFANLDDRPAGSQHYTERY
jgi:replicative DNA helicase